MIFFFCGTAILLFSQFSFASSDIHVTNNKTYINLEVPYPINNEISDIRHLLGSKSKKLPVEITLTGSSGVGSIPKGTSLDLIKQEVNEIAENQSPFEVRFSEISTFPNTGVFYLVPEKRKVFDDLHSLFLSSKITFLESKWPFNPHLTIRNEKSVDKKTAEKIMKMDFPHKPFLIDTISVYELNELDYKATLIYQVKLSG